MIEVIFYQKIEDLVTAESNSKPPLIITPSPIVADGMRRLMPAASEIITISKWVSDYLKSKDLKRSNKAELMLRLSSVWRHYFPEAEAYLFFKSFEIFTDLRSFSLSLELLSEFLRELDNVTAKSILVFWTFLKNEKIIDEHLSYQLISEASQVGPIWIVGFKHLSGIQIDMLKVLGEKTEINVFIPKEVYLESISSDWVRWLIPEAKIEILDERKKLKVVHFPKNKLNIVLDALRRQMPRFDLSLASSSLSLNSRQEVADPNLFFKSQEDLFSVCQTKLLEDFHEEIKAMVSIDLESFLKQIEEKKIKAQESEDYILYKTLHLLSDALIIYGEFQTVIDSFSLKIFKKILELNSPRVFLATLTDKPETRLLELNELPYRKSSLPLVIVAASSYGPLKSSDIKYNEKMIDALRIISPIKRAGLDFAYLKSELIQTLSCNSNLLLMEEGLDVVDLSWGEILKGFDLEIVNVNADYRLKEMHDYLLGLIRPGPHKFNKLSASRMQAFLDCPRKYYFTYIEKLDHRPVERLKIAADEMGTIEHEIIASYFNNMDISSLSLFESDHHEKLCRLALDNFVIKNKITLNEKNKLSTFYELLHYTQNGIEFLISFCRENRALDMSFEFRLPDNPWDINGSIDCIVHLPENQIALFDFKRSSAAIGTKADTMAFNKIQIWTYLLMMNRLEGKAIHSWGYINLSDILGSVIYTEADTQKVDEFQKFLEVLVEKIKAEIHFRAEPRTGKACDFCDVQLFCSKGVCKV